MLAMIEGGEDEVWAVTMSVKQRLGLVNCNISDYQGMILPATLLADNV